MRIKSFLPLKDSQHYGAGAARIAPFVLRHTASNMNVLEATTLSFDAITAHLQENGLRSAGIDLCFSGLSFSRMVTGNFSMLTINVLSSRLLEQ
jgi:hypothetical protein